VEDDFRLAMDQRRAEALADLRAERERLAAWVRHSRDETTRQCRAELAAAEETAQRIVAAARRRVEELTVVREQVAAQLHAARAQLHGTIATLSPLHDPPLDTAAPDTGTHDTPSDTTAPRTTGLGSTAPDTAAADSATPDSATPDTAAPHTAALDTAAPDTAALDAAAPDTEPTTRPIATVTDTRVLDAPVPDDGGPALPDSEGEALEVPAQAGPPDVAGPAAHPSVPDPAEPRNDEGHRPTARRRRRRPPTGATRR
jgi:hypothetical protein